MAPAGLEVADRVPNELLNIIFKVLVKEEIDEEEVRWRQDGSEPVDGVERALKYPPPAGVPQLSVLRRVCSRWRSLGKELEASSWQTLFISGFDPSAYERDTLLHAEKRNGPDAYMAAIERALHLSAGYPLHIRIDPCGGTDQPLTDILNRITAQEMERLESLVIVNADFFVYNCHLNPILSAPALLSLEVYFWSRDRGPEEYMLLDELASWLGPAIATPSISFSGEWASQILPGALHHSTLAVDGPWSLATWSSILTYTSLHLHDEWTAVAGWIGTLHLAVNLQDAYLSSGPCAGDRHSRSFIRSEPLPSFVAPRLRTLGISAERAQIWKLLDAGAYPLLTTLSLISVDRHFTSDPPLLNTADDLGITYWEPYPAATAPSILGRLLMLRDLILIRMRLAEMDLLPILLELHQLESLTVEGLAEITETEKDGIAVWSDCTRYPIGVLILHALGQRSLLPNLRSLGLGPCAVDPVPAVCNAIQELVVHRVRTSLGLLIDLTAMYCRQHSSAAAHLRQWLVDQGFAEYCIPGRCTEECVQKPIWDAPSSVHDLDYSSMPVIERAIWRKLGEGPCILCAACRSAYVTPEPTNRPYFPYQPIHDEAQWGNSAVDPWAG